MQHRTRLFIVAIACSLPLTSVESARGQSLIRQPGNHPHYVFEAEPHLVLRTQHHEGDANFGPGFRGAITIVDQGFVASINNSVAIGFGADWLMAGNEHCKGKPPEPKDCHHHERLIFPVVMQWNFWLHERWSVFGEPGFALWFRGDDHPNEDDDPHFDPFIFHAGGRFHFTERITLTMRLGFPGMFSLGVSFLL